MSKESLFRYLLASDADSRTLATKENKTGYGTSIEFSNKVQFGSCTASTPTKSSYFRALETFNSLGLDVANLHDPDTVSDLYLYICDELLDIFGINDDECSIFLTPSGTDVEILASSILVRNKGNSITNYIVAPVEIGSGSVNATEGKRFSSISPDGSLGEVGLREFTNLKTQKIKLIEFRDSEAKPRDYHEWENELIEKLLETSENKVLHYVNCTKTGVEVPKESTISVLNDRFGKKIDFVVDAAQGRMEREDIKRWVREGKMVYITGSKFFSSPPFCCALFVPKNYDISRIWSRDFHTYFDQLSFPVESRSMGQENSLTKPRTGHLVRWLFGLENMKSFYSIPKKSRISFIERFSNHATEHIQSHTEIFDMLENKQESFSPHGSIISFHIKKSESERYANYNELRILYYHLLDSNEEFHIPQPTKLLEENEEIAVFRISIGSDLIEKHWKLSQSTTTDYALEILCDQISRCLDEISSMAQEMENLGKWDKE